MMEIKKKYQLLSVLTVNSHQVRYCSLYMSIYSFFACRDFCHLLITFANSLDPDQDRHNVGPDLNPNGLTL